MADSCSVVLVMVSLRHSDESDETVSLGFFELLLAANFSDAELDVLLDVDDDDDVVDTGVDSKQLGDAIENDDDADDGVESKCSPQKPLSYILHFLTKMHK